MMNMTMTDLMVLVNAHASKEITLAKYNDKEIDSDYIINRVVKDLHTLGKLDGITEDDILVAIEEKYNIPNVLDVIDRYLYEKYGLL